MEGKSIVYTEEAQIVHVFKDNQSIRDYHSIMVFNLSNGRQMKK